MASAASIAVRKSFESGVTLLGKKPRPETRIILWVLVLSTLVVVVRGHPLLLSRHVLPESPPASEAGGAGRNF